MCYSAKIYADFRKYERYGGTLDLRAFVKLFWERQKSGDWIERVDDPVGAYYQHELVSYDRS